MKCPVFKSSVFLFLLLFCSIVLAKQADTKYRKVHLTPIDKVKVSGDLNIRMTKAVEYLDRATPENMWNGFTTGMWGADWPGRTLEAYSRVSLALGYQCSTRFDEIGKGLVKRQSPDGAFHNGHANSDYDKGSGLWFGNARGMLGLLWASRYTSEFEYFNKSLRY